jgi:hypothetical protein
MQYTKRWFPFLSVLLILAIVALVGCVTRNPVFDESLPPSPANPQFIVDAPKIGAAADTARAVNTATAPFNPYMPITGTLIDPIAAIVLSISGVWAKRKNDEAAKQKAAAASMAQVIKAGGGTDKALANAATPATAAAIAEHLQNS